MSPLHQSSPPGKFPVRAHRQECAPRRRWPVQRRYGRTQGAQIETEMVAIALALQMLY
jgi:hypothetical protein